MSAPQRVDVGELTIEADATPVLVDDIVSSGATVIQAVERLSAIGCAPSARADLVEQLH